MNLKIIIIIFFFLREILVPNPCFFQMLWTSYKSWNGFLFRQKIWLIYSSNTSQYYLRYKIEVNFLDSFYNFTNIMMLALL